MHILIFTNGFGGGDTERAATTLANYWAGRRRRVTLLTLAPASDDFYVLDPEVQRIALDLDYADKGMLQTLRQSWHTVTALRRILVEQRPSVAIAMTSTANVLLAFASYKLDVCAIGTETAHIPLTLLDRACGALRVPMYRCLTAVVAQNRESADWLETRSAAARVAVIPNAALWPLPQHAPRIAPDALVGSGQRILLALGPLDPDRNFGTLLHAFSELAFAHPSWHLVVLGEGPQRPVLQAAARLLSAGVRIHLPGVAGNIGEWYARADLYVTTSRSEGFPNTLAEALSHGLPAVSVDSDPGPRNVIRNGMDGLLVAPGCVDKLIESLGQLMGDDELRHCFAMRARDARDRFSFVRIAALWEDLFRELAKVRRERREGTGLARRARGKG